MEVIIPQVNVRDNNVEQAMRVLKKKMQQDGLFRLLKIVSSHEKPSEKKARRHAEAVRKIRKLERKRIEKEGF